MRARSGIGRQRAGDQLPTIVEASRDPVNGADEGAASSADHAEAQAPVERRSFDPAIVIALLRGLRAASRPSMRRLAASSVPPAAKSSKAFSVTRMMWCGDELRSFASAILRMLQAAFPLQHGPGIIVVLCELGEDRAEIDLSVSKRPEPARAVNPVLISAIDADAGRVGLNSASLTWNALMRS